MSHLTRSSTRSAARRGRPVRLLLILIAATLAAGCLAYVAITTMGTGHRAPAGLTALAARTGQAVTAAPAKAAAQAAAAASTTASTATPVPPAPSGWTTVFGDNFAGAGRLRAVAQANWFYDIGTGYGTGENEQTTNSTNNVYLDGNGHLVLKATHATAAPGHRPDRVHPRRLPGPAGRQARDDRVDRAAEPGQRPRLLARVLGARLAHADRRRLAAVRRARHDGGRQRAQRGLADAARLGEQPRPPADRLPGHPVPDRLPHLLGDH